MRKTCTLLVGILLTTAFAFSQKKSNPKIGKNETEVSSFVLADEYVAFGGQVVYRLAIKKLKIGGGVLYGANFQDTYDADVYGYGAVFADAVQFLGHREKWSFGGQFGHGIYKNYYNLTAGIYWSISCSYRAMLSKGMLLTTSLLLGERNFHDQFHEPLVTNSGFGGLRLGVVF